MIGFADCPTLLLILDILEIYLNFLAFGNPRNVLDIWYVSSWKIYVQNYDYPHHPQPRVVKNMSDVVCAMLPVAAK